MAYTIFIWNQGDDEFQGTISWGSNWWIEKNELTNEEISYKIVEQTVINNVRIICVCRMNNRWTGENYYGTDTIVIKRKIFSGIPSIPKTQAEWLMSIHALQN